MEDDNEHWHDSSEKHSMMYVCLITSIPLLFRSSNML
jgi:hypothetical protein